MQKEIYNLLQEIRKEIELIEKRLDEIEKNSTNLNSSENEHRNEVK
ncbi:hypothetical protein [Clostridium peptidivorans]|nr:hypothetical protein [Clostridium peptidivorans]